MNILGIDLGTKTGYCYNSGNELCAGTWQLATPKEVKEWGKSRRKEDFRVCRLFEKLMAIAPGLDAIVFEDVVFATTTYQVQLWAGFRTVVWMLNCLNDYKIEIDCVPVGTLKKFATGNGAASKE